MIDISALNETAGRSGKRGKKMRKAGGAGRWVRPTRPEKSFNAPQDGTLRKKGEGVWPPTRQSCPGPGERLRRNPHPRCKTQGKQVLRHETSATGEKNHLNQVRKGGMTHLPKRTCSRPRLQGMEVGVPGSASGGAGKGGSSKVGKNAVGEGEREKVFRTARANGA